MRKELKSIAEYRKPSNDAFATVARSFGEASNRLKALAIESVGRAVEIQSQFVAKAYDTYISEISKLGRMFFFGYRTFTPRPQSLPYANLNEKKVVIVSNARRLKPKSMLSPRGDGPPPRVCLPNARQELSRRVSPALRDRARPRGRPVQSIAESVSNKRSREVGLPRRRPCPTLSYLLARALRSSDDRGHGLRHASPCLQSRCGAGSDP